MIIEKLYGSLVKQSSDINEHLPALRVLSSICEHVTEFGVRNGVSTVALLAGKPKKLISYDISDFPGYKMLKKAAETEGVEFTFIQRSVIPKEGENFTIEDTDMLFIDTYHVYNQMKKELETHSGYVKRFIVFHDTVTFGEIGEDGGLGIMPAIKEFLSRNEKWEILTEFKNNNGLMILRNRNLLSL